MNKKIKSLLVAGLLVVGMGFATVDSYAAEINIENPKTVNAGYSEPVYAYDENGIKVLVVNISGMGGPNAPDGGYPEGTYDVSIEWDESKVKVNSANLTYVGAVDEAVVDNPFTINGNRANLRVHVPTEFTIDSIDIDYDLVGEQEPVVSFNDAEQKVINKYRESMASVGVLNNGERQIDTSFMIEKQAWLDFIDDVNEADNYVTIEEGNEKGEYHVYTNVSGEKKLIEVIFIDFFESDSKGWVPEITPGTGQAIAVGGMVVLAAAGVGLLVNNKKKKDEEK